jgi:predicted DNA-binding transcriptional regulator YafY
MSDERYIDARELAARMGVSVRTVNRLTAAGMPSETWGMARTRRYLPSQAIAWAHSRGGFRSIDRNNDHARQMTTAERHREE